MLSTTKYSFLDFPPEIRLMIYPLIFSDDPDTAGGYNLTPVNTCTDVWRESRRSRPSRSGQFLRTCKTVYKEAHTCLYEGCLFKHNDSAREVGAVLDKMGPANTKLINHLVLRANKLEWKSQRYLGVLFDHTHRMNLKTFQVTCVPRPGRGRHVFYQMKKVLIFLVKLVKIYPILCHALERPDRSDDRIYHIRLVAERVKLVPDVSFSPNKACRQRY